MTDIDQNDLNSRTELMEQHQIIVGDLNKEINRLQEENKGNTDTEVSRKYEFMQYI